MCLDDYSVDKLLENPDTEANFFTIKIGNEVMNLFDCAAGEDTCTKENESAEQSKHEICLEGGTAGKETPEFKVRFFLV